MNSASPSDRLIRLGILGAGQLALMLALVLPGHLSAATIQGRVVDLTGAAVDAYVFVYDSGKHPKTALPLPGLTAVADGKGNFSLSVSPGSSDICVFGPIFLPACHRVSLKTDYAIVTEHFKLKFDPKAITKEVE